MVTEGFSFFVGAGGASQSSSKARLELNKQTPRWDLGYGGWLQRIGRSSQYQISSIDFAGGFCFDFLQSTGILLLLQLQMNHQLLLVE
jgi:hypothetical protein